MVVKRSELTCTFVSVLRQKAEAAMLAQIRAHLTEFGVENAWGCSARRSALTNAPSSQVYGAEAAQKFEGRDPTGGHFDKQMGAAPDAVLALCPASCGIGGTVSGESNVSTPVGAKPM